ncbi:hypothetical protein EMPS_02313 [Entomortierella parvispora]|uniref:FAD-binding domain-containing protein n=1 Tax=Entomortierella parvispora TaxID=205924 RepID=A0A9P3H4M8_9FUNG|nr:hypothetical protein EMPS_02313 [Entomortierella parvispora]
MPPPSDLRVIIVGAGLAGLIMAIMLEKAGIDYHILEQASRLRPLGTSISLHPVILDIVDQLGLLDEMVAMSKPLRGITVLSSKGRKVGRIDTRSKKQKRGHQAMVMSRPDLHELLLSKIPAQKLTTGMRVLGMTETQSGVLVTCADESTFFGHLVVGADGAYSATRRIMYSDLKMQGLLPEADKTPLYVDKQCVVGMTCPLDPVKYPVLLDSGCEVKVLLGKDQHTSMWILPLQGNRLAWCVGGPDPQMMMQDTGSGRSSPSNHSHGSGRQSPPSSIGRGRQSPTSSGRNSPQDWYPETAVEICEDVRNFKCPYGGSVMDIIDATPKGLVSKVLLEEKMCCTWYHGRIVLIGDACHKIVPFFGQGASQAILDAACLVNMLYDLPSRSSADLTAIFKSYVEQRSGPARVASDSSREFADLIYDQGFKADVARSIVLRFTPMWLLRMITGTTTGIRPGLTFLPPPTGTGKLL